MAQHLFIENALVESLYHNNAVKQAFPFIKEAADRHAKLGSKGKACCGNTASYDEYNKVKASIAHMGPEDRNKLKQILNAEMITIKFVVSGKRTQVTF